ncbi:MAG: hypothetical protein ACI841_001993 [Planctomycetota bacterium]|jgi:hypothetical protein
MDFIRQRASAWSLLILITLPSCLGVGHELRSNSMPGQDVVALEGVAARYEPSLSALGQAVAEGENGLAGTILGSLRIRIETERSAWRLNSGKDSEDNLGRIPGTRALQIVDGYERILDGRERMAGLTLELHAVRVAESATIEVELWARSSWPTALEFHPGPATLSMQTSHVAADGRQAHHAHSIGLTSIDRLLVNPGAATVISLGRYDVIVPPRMLAQRERWMLSLRSGNVEEEGRGMPVGPLEASPCYWTERAKFLPTSVVEPQDLLEYVTRKRGAAAAGDQTTNLAEYDREVFRYTAPLMERAVRIEEPRRAEAIDLLRPVIARSTDAVIERLQPALRWLMRTSRPGSDPELWRRWARGELAAGQEAQEVYEGLELPAAGRSPRGRSR